MIKYDFKVNPWQVIERNFPVDRDTNQKLSFLLRYAVLAPSSHNTQPWKFSVGDGVIGVFVNNDRWLRVADADQREIYISVGCAIENLLIAAEHFGYGHSSVYFPDPANPRLAAVISLTPGGEPSPFRGRELFDAITARHTNHKAYEERPISGEDLARIKDCSVEEGLSLYLTSDADLKRKVDGLISRADAIQFADPLFRKELSHWIGQGVFGTPWLIAKLSQLAVSYLDLGSSVAKKDSDVLMSAPVFGMLCSEENNRESHVKIGQAFERIYLTVTSLGLSIQPISQVLQVPEVKKDITGVLPLPGLFPQQPFRLGYAAPEKGHTPRRPLEEVLA